MEALATLDEDLEWISVEESSAAGRVRRAAVAVAERLGFSEHRAGEVAIAATELATNLHRHAVKGVIALRIRRRADGGAVELIAIDSGPGIADLTAATRDGESTRGTLGIGLGAAMRLATWFDAYSAPGRGTVIAATFWNAQKPAPRPAVGSVTRPIDGEDVCGDACAYRLDEGSTTLMLADGLGHGEIAAQVAQRAVRAFEEAPAHFGPAQLLGDLNEKLRGSRGAAVAILRFARAAAGLTFAGIGNVATWTDDGERRHSLVSSPGIVGTYARSIREVEVPLAAGSLLLLHSDGLTSKWDLDAYPGLRSHGPQLVAATLMRDAAVRRDDASVLVAKAS